MASQPNRDVRLDLVRAIGIIGVLFIHVAGYVVNLGRASIPLSCWLAADMINSLARAGVPLFFMVSGALLLGKGTEENVATFFRKRLSRITVPFVVWSLAYLLYNDIGAKRSVAASDFIRILAEPAHYHLWFLYSIFGLYLVTPLLRPLMKGADRWYVPILWILTIPVFFALETFTQVRFNPNFTRVLPVYVGFFAGGYLLKDAAISRVRAWACWVLLCIGWAVTAAGNYYLDGIGFTGYAGYFNDYLSLPVVMMSVCGYLLLMNRRVAIDPVRPSAAASAIKRISACSMGIYLVHPMILDLLNSSLMPFRINGMLLHPVIGIPLTVAVVLCITLALVSWIRKIPALKLGLGLGLGFMVTASTCGA